MLKTGKPILMTAPVLASRCPAFAPSIRQGKTEWSVDTPWGNASVTGELTQIHRNVLDAIFAHAIAIDTSAANGAIEILLAMCASGSRFAHFYGFLPSGFDRLAASAKNFLALLRPFADSNHRCHPR